MVIHGSIAKLNQNFNLTIFQPNSDNYLDNSFRYLKPRAAQATLHYSVRELKLTMCLTHL